MEQKQKNQIMSAMIYAVIFIAYNLLIFIAFKGFNSVFFISYVFMIIFYLIHIACAFSILRKEHLRAVFFGIPLLYFSIFFVAAEFFCSLVFMIFRAMASVKIAVLMQSLLLCAFLVILILSVMTRDNVENVDNKIKENTSFIKGLNVDVEMMLHKSTNPEITKRLKNLSETIKYSDPMTNRSVSVQEQMIIQCMAELRMTFDAGKMDQVRELCEKMELLFLERNKKLMISK